MDGSDLVDKGIILDYLNRELNNISKPKKEKPIPVEARTGAMLSIRAMINFVEKMQIKG